MQLIRELNIVLPGDIYPTLLPIGTEVSGSVAQTAIEAGCVEGEESANWAAKAADDIRIAAEAEVAELEKVAIAAVAAFEAAGAALAGPPAPASKPKATK